MGEPSVKPNSRARYPTMSITARKKGHQPERLVIMPVVVLHIADEEAEETEAGRRQHTFSFLLPLLDNVSPHGTAPLTFMKS